MELCKRFFYSTLLSLAQWINMKYEIYGNIK